MTFDTVLRGGTVATAEGVFEADVAFKGGRIAALGQGLPAGGSEVDVSGKVLTPGGVDPHCHVEQLTASGLMNADTFEQATASALAGGTTTIIPFAAQHVGMSATEVVADYHARAERGALVDHAFHVIVTDPTPEVVERELPDLIAQGHGSLKCFTTYDRLRVDDEQLLDVLACARANGAMVMVHAENHGLISWMGKRLVAGGHHRPAFHVPSHPRLGEAEAINRVIALAEFVDQPVMIYHVSTREGVDAIRAARGRGVKVFGETCTQYLTLTSADLDRPGMEGAMWMCSPPLREPDDQEALWQGLADGTLQLVSSDHAPYRMDDTGKLNQGPKPHFKQVANGMPGLQMRLPVLFDAMVTRGRMGLSEFVRLTATEPAKIYNLHPLKGSLMPGADADVAVWDPHREVEVTHETERSNAGYSPYDGRKLKGAVERVFLRGVEAFAGEEVKVEPGFGRFLPRGGGEAAVPTGRLPAELDPSRNFGANLI